MPSFADVRQFPWLTEHEPPSVSLARGVQAGSAIASNLLRARAVQIEQSNQMLREAKFVADQQNLNAINEGFTALSAVTGNISKDGAWLDPNAKAQFYGIVARYPFLVKQPGFKGFLDAFHNAENAQLERDKIIEQGKLRRDIAGMQIEGRSDLSEQQHQQKLEEIAAKYEELGQLQENSQEWKDKHAEIQNSLNMLRDKVRPRPAESGRIDLLKSDEIPYRNELAGLKSALDQGLLRVKGKPASSAYERYNELRQQIDDKYKARALKQNQPEPAAIPAVSPKRVRVKAPDGTIGSIPESQLDEAKRSGYTLAE